MFLLSKLGLRAKERKRQRGRKLSSRERTNIKSGGDLHVLVRDKLDTQNHTHTHIHPQNCRMHRFSLN